MVESRCFGCRDLENFSQKVKRGQMVGFEGLKVADEKIS